MCYVLCIVSIYRFGHRSHIQYMRHILSQTLPSAHYDPSSSHQKLRSMLGSIWGAKHSHRIVKNSSNNERNSVKGQTDLVWRESDGCQHFAYHTRVHVLRVLRAQRAQPKHRHTSSQSFH